jgi:hypothetical protein
MGELESDISLLSHAVLGQSVEQIKDFQKTLERLKSGYGPFSLTLFWDDDNTDRRSVVLHEWKDDQILVFDPSHSLSTEEGTGMVLLSADTVRSWFQDKDAIALVPQSR